MTISRHRLALAVVCGMAGFLMSCGGGASDPSSSGADVAGPSNVAPECPPPEVVQDGTILECHYPDIVFDVDADPAERGHALAEFARRGGDEGLASALDGGEVTVAVRRQGYQDALDCMTEQGMGVAQFEEYDGLFGTEFVYIATWGALGEDEASRVSTECEDRHTTLLEKANEILEGGRFTERTKAVLQECLERHGGTGAVGDTIDELREVIPNADVEMTCLAEADDRPPLPDDLPRPPDG